MAQAAEHAHRGTDGKALTNLVWKAPIHPMISAMTGTFVEGSTKASFCQAAVVATGVLPASRRSSGVAWLSSAQAARQLTRSFSKHDLSGESFLLSLCVPMCVVLGAMASAHIYLPVHITCAMAGGIGSCKPGGAHVGHSRQGAGGRGPGQCMW